MWWSLNQDHEYINPTVRETSGSQKGKMGLEDSESTVQVAYTKQPKNINFIEYLV